jgi:hypothetical protein
MLRPTYLVFAGVVLSNLGTGRSRPFFEVVGTLVVIGGIVDVILGAGR